MLATTHTLMFNDVMFIRSRDVIPPTIQDTSTNPSTKGLVQAAFITLRSGLLAYSKHHPESTQDVTLDEINYCLRNRRFTEMGVIVARNGFVLNKVTKGGLIDYSHRLKVPIDGTPADYHREPFNIDDQCVPGPAINLSGEDTIAKNKDAVIEVLSFERDVIYSALTNWEGYTQQRSRVTTC